MTKERILLMIEQLLKIYNEMEKEKSENVEFVWEDEEWNGIYKIK